MGHLKGKTAIVTGAGGGFGRLIAARLADGGARVLGVDINGEGADETARRIRGNGGTAEARQVDVTKLDDMRGAAAFAIECFGRIDVLVNNAGIMPLAFFSDHLAASASWDKAIDVNVKGTVHGISAVYDQMISQGGGHIVNISSIYGNAGIAGAGVYSATKMAVNAISEALRNEAKGKIKVTLVKPTGVPGTNLAREIVNPDAARNLSGHLAAEYDARISRSRSGTLTPEESDPDNVGYSALDADQLVASVLYAIDQPWGVNISDVTVRATGDYYVY